MNNEVWDDLVTFESSGIKKGEIFVSISKSHAITLSASFARKADKNIKFATHIVLSYSKNNNALILNFTNDGDTPGSYKITKGVNLSVAARSFFSFFDLDINQYAGRYLPEEMDIPRVGKRWGIFLNKKK
ncbi:MAG TPA: hypothetical protein DF296_02610 [Candidatus Margulisbacteria bacterium]|nr:MAG: hypothetical protein A2X41_10025 [Candidatus Margulisbacteria bacterium GWE2_39_32]HCT84071.1 hypothetical protein [Candidatus Margulisiibacteriota bacterium]